MHAHGSILTNCTRAIEYLRGNGGGDSGRGKERAWVVVGWLGKLTARDEISLRTAGFFACLSQSPPSLNTRVTHPVTQQDGIEVSSFFLFQKLLPVTIKKDLDLSFFKV